MNGQKNFYENILNRILPDPVTVTGISPVGGGCIHHAVGIETGSGAKYFVKSNQVADADMFEKEFLGLRTLREAGSLYIPEPLGHGTEGPKAYIVTEFIEGGHKKADFWRKFAEGLAGLHRHISAQYGFDHDNYIGRLPQRNDRSSSWIEFFTGNRLEVQLRLAVDQQRVDASFARRFREMMRHFPEILPEEPPSLLHGDLWSGNFLTGANGDAVLIDPAVYYGNREIELSFTKMFGGFEDSFYRYYDEVYPLSPGFDDRVDIYNLYPSLVHLNLFGSAYLGGIEYVLRRFG